jgi:hypothetical protein
VDGRAKPGHDGGDVFAQAKDPLHFQLGVKTFASSEGAFWRSDHFLFFVIFR